MHLRRRSAAGLAVCLAVAGLAVATATTSAAGATDGHVRMHGSLSSAARPGARIGRVAGSQALTVQLWLKPNVAGATRFANAVSTRGNAQFHHFLSPAAYTRRFGASARTAARVRTWLSRQGFRAVRSDAQRNYVSATGSVSTVQSAFRVRMNRYRVMSAHGRSTVIQSNDREISLPRSLSRLVLSVTGLNSTKPQALHTAAPRASAAPPDVCSHYWGEHSAPVTPAFKGQTSLSTIGCGYSAGQLRGAYGMNTTNVGKGRRVALIEIGTPYKMFKTLTRYAAKNGLPAPQSTQYQELAVGQGDACGNFFDVEEQLDSEAVYAMAPAASQLLVGGDSCQNNLEGFQALFDAQTIVLNGTGRSPLAAIESNSWGLTGGEVAPTAYVKTAHSILLRAAAEGVTMVFASGDNPVVSVPASDPYALAVGGTTLGLGQSGSRIFETGWSNDDAFKDNGKWIDVGIGRDGAGGGRSLIFGEPRYQRGVVPSSMTHLGIGTNQADRTVPDISALADAATGILQIDTVATRKGDRFEEFVDGGTSLSAPMVAGMLADAMQGQPKRFGFINRAVYSLAGSSAFHDALPVTSSTPSANRGAICPKEMCGVAQLSLFDSQLPAYTDLVTAKGYDTMTGIGTPNGQPFIKALRKAES